MTQERLSLRKIREILRLKEEAGLSNRSIARACNISNSTVGEYVRRAKAADLHWPLPPEISEEELYRKLFPEEAAAAEKDRPLPDFAYLKEELKKKGVTFRLLWEEYKDKHPNNYYQYTQFCEHYRRWAKTKSPSARLPHTGGEVMEVDYAGLTMTLVNPESGAARQVPVFVATLPASDYIYAEVQSSQEKCNWINGHVRAYAFFGGIPKILRPDNLKSGVTRPDYYEPDLNPTYQEMAEYYQVAVLPARVRKPKDKGTVENGVQNIERWVIAPLRNQTFFSLGEMNRAVQKQVEALNNKVMAHLGKSRRQVYEEVDLPALRPLPEKPYQFALWKMAKVNIDYHVAFEKHFYSVPHALVRQQVEIKASEHLVEIFHKGKQVAIHPRNSVQGRFSTRPEHMPSNHRFILELDADWLLKQAREIGPHSHAYLQALLKSRPFPEQAYRQCLGVLSLGRKYPHPTLESACQQALQAHLFSYKQLKAELDALVRRSATPIPPPPLLHENIRGGTYFN
jgi:transposase